MTDAIYKSVFHSLRQAFIHTSTFSENSLAMRAGIATMHVLQQERLVARADSLGKQFRERLRAAVSPYEMVKEVRGQGMLTGIEFQAPRNLSMRMSFEAFKAIHPGLFGQILVMRLFNHEICAAPKGVSTAVYLRLAASLASLREHSFNASSIFSSLMPAISGPISRCATGIPLSL